MKFLGSKAKIAKELLSVMLPYRKHRTWIEPFVGGGNMIDKVDGHRIGYDDDFNVILALITIRDSVDVLPKDNTKFTEDDYLSLRDNFDCPYRAFAGFAYSYGGKWLGGWRRDKEGKRDYVAEAYRSAKKQSEKLQGVKLFCETYYEAHYPEPYNSLIYCDPPYQGTTRYSKKFNHDHFWNWCREMARDGYLLFVSEYNAPEDFKCIWSKKVNNTLVRDTGSKQGIEKLFIYGGKS